MLRRHGVVVIYWDRGKIDWLEWDIEDKTIGCNGRGRQMDYLEWRLK